MVQQVVVQQVVALEKAHLRLEAPSHCFIRSFRKTTVQENCTFYFDATSDNTVGVTYFLTT
jgi:hypothetical protein